MEQTFCIKVLKADNVFQNSIFPLIERPDPIFTVSCHNLRSKDSMEALMNKPPLNLSRSEAFKDMQGPFFRHVIEYCASPKCCISLYVM